MLATRLGLVIAFAAMCLAIAPSESPTAKAVISTGELSKFKIESLTVSTTNRTAREVNTYTGDDRGGIALSANNVFLRGDSYLGYFNKSDLTTAASTSGLIVHDAIVSDLKSMTAYVFDITAASGNFTKLTQLDQTTGAVPASPTVITLSSAVPYNGGEIYSGYGRVVYRNSNGTVYDIDLPSGTVYNRGAVSVTRMGTESVTSWFSWGVAEFFDGELYLTVSNAGSIVRYKVSDGSSTIVATGSGFSDMASFIVDPTNQRWYFHYEGSAPAFAFGSDETLGFASAVITTTPSITLTPSSSITNANSLSVSVTYGEAVTGVDASDFTLGGTATGWSISSLVANSSTSYTLNLTQVGSAGGTLNVSVGANSAYWTAGLMNIPDTAVTSSNVTVDHDPPTASYTSQPTSPAAAMSLSFGVSFNESVSGISASDFSNSGTAAGCVFTPSAASGTSITVTVTQCQEGTLQLTLAANSVNDAAANNGPTSALNSNVITLQASALTVTAGDKSISYGGSWTDTYTAATLIGADTITVTYTYSGTTNDGGTYGPSATKPTLAGTYSIIPSVTYGVSNANRYSLTKVNGTLTIARVAQSALTVSSTSGTYGIALTLTSSGGTGTGAVSYAVSSGACSVLGSLLTLGDAGSTCNVVATKAQDNNYNAVSSVATAITTNRANQGALTLTSTSATFGQPLTLTTSGGSGSGAVSYVVSSGTCTVNGSTLTPGDAGSVCNVTATKALDTNYNAVSSSATAISVARAAQATLTITSTSATYGQTLSLATSGGSGTGAVTYSVVSGTCTIASTTLTPGNAGSTCVVKATKALSTNYNAADSIDTTITIARATQSTLTVASTTGTYGVALSLTTSGGSGTGAVSFTVSSGTCFVLGSLLTLGDAGSLCSVVATKAQDTNYLEASSVSTAVNTNRASQSALTITTTSATYGETLTLATSGGSGAGAVSYAVASGTCTVNGATLTPGDAGSVCNVVATKALETNYNAVASASTAISIARTSQAALTVTSTSATYGQTMTLTASGGSGSGAVSYSVVSGTCTVSGSTLTPGDAGSACVVKATKALSTNYNAIDSADATVSIARATQSALSVTSTTATYGQTLSLTTSGGSGTGSVSLAVSSGSCFVIGTLLTVGDAGSSCAVVATKAQDTNYVVVSSSSTTITINKATQSALSVTSTTATYGQTLSLTTSGGSGAGSVSFTVMSGTCTVNGNTLTPGNAGSACVVKATKATDTNYNERSSSNTTVTVNKAGQVGLNFTSANSFTTGGALVLAASGGQSSGSLSWALASGSCILTGNIVSATRGGITCVVEVTRAGDSNYLADTASDTITVNKISQLLTFRTTAPSSPMVGTNYTVAVDSDASLTPTLAIAGSSSSVCSLSNGVVSFNTTGSCVISASQAGTDVYASAAASQSITVVAVPVTTVPAPPATSNGATTDVSTTLPQKAVAAAVSTSSTTSTTTTTTTIPADPSNPVLGADGQPVELKAGEATAIVSGKAVKVNVQTNDGQMVLKVGDDIQLKLGSTDPSSNSARVNSDGTLVAFGNQFVDVNMQGLIPGTTYTIFMFSQPIELGRGTADENGAIVKRVLVPKDVDTGGHTLQINGVGPKGDVVSLSVGMKILKKESNMWPAIISITLAMLLALLGGRPIFRRRRLAQ